MILELPFVPHRTHFLYATAKWPRQIIAMMRSDSSNKLFMCFIEFHLLLQNPTGVDSSVHTDEICHKARERAKTREKWMVTDPTPFTNYQINKSTNTCSILNKVQEHSWILPSNKQIKVRKCWILNIQKCSVQNPI